MNTPQEELRWMNKYERNFEGMWIMCSVVSGCTFLTCTLIVILHSHTPVVFTVYQYENRVCPTNVYDSQEYCGIVDVSWFHAPTNKTGACSITLSRRKEPISKDEELLYVKKKQINGYLADRYCIIEPDYIKNYEEISEILSWVILISGIVLLMNLVSYAYWRFVKYRLEHEIGKIKSTINDRVY